MNGDFVPVPNSPLNWPHKFYKNVKTIKKEMVPIGN